MLYEVITAWINQDAIVEAWHELLENTGIAWPVYGCEVEAIHCAFESTGVITSYSIHYTKLYD